MSDTARDQSADPDELYGLTAELVRAVRDAISDGAVARIEELVDPLHAADLADLLEALDPEERRLLVAIVRHTFDPETLSYLDETVREQIMEMIGPLELAHAVAELDTDDAVDLLEDLDEDEKRRILESVPAEDRQAIEEGLTFPEDSAGRMMQRELVAVPQHWTVGETIDFLRASKDLPDDFYDLFVVDPRHHPVGTVPLSRAMRNMRAVKLIDIMETDLRPVPATMDQESVAYLFRQYGLVSAPVVDDNGRLLGAVTVDDVVHVIDEEAAEDLLGIVGAGDTGFHAKPWTIAWTRFRWLLLVLANVAVASFVVSQFEGTIREIVVLAVLMPIVAAMGGSAGVQVVTNTVRALATRDLSSRNQPWRFVLKEMTVALMNAAAFGVIAGGGAWAWTGQWRIGVVLAAALVLNMLWAGFGGTIVPLLLERMGVDPAHGAGPFLTATTDVVGFFCFLGLATLVLL
ncbi:MAG: magnesium transporter [Rhodospirillaceae bacterium]|nr:magnesium transporter [Rhodospirillaceae bacterium]